MSRPIQNQEIQRLIQSTPIVSQPTVKDQNRSIGPSFDHIFSELNIKVSGHAQTRLESRDINLNREEWGKVYEAINKAEVKGAKESLVLVQRDSSGQNAQQDVALIVSVKNRTVITAVKDLKENVFTNIDSAVIVEV